MNMAQKKDFSERKIKLLKERLKASEAFKDLDTVTCYAVGSIGRLEASQKSDIDAFFVNAPNTKESNGINLKKIKMFSEFIRISEELDFPEISNDGQFLEVLNLSDIKKNFGAPADDFDNLFTARMLLILESKCIYGEVIYNRVLNEVLETYFKDFEGHSEDFEPKILLNDIVRYWKTLCLNYENKRNNSNSTTDDSKLQIKSFKLKYSRMITCFGTIISICATENLTKEEFLKLCQKTPLERIEYIIDDDCQKEIELLNKLTELYEKFLNCCDDYDETGTFDFSEQLQSDANCFSKTLDEILKQTSKNEDQIRMLLL